MNHGPYGTEGGASPRPGDASSISSELREVRPMRLLIYLDLRFEPAEREIKILERMIQAWGDTYLLDISSIKVREATR